MTFGDPLLVAAALLLAAAWLRHGSPRGVVPRWAVVAPVLLLAAGLLAILPSEDTGSLTPTIQFCITLGVMPLIMMFAASTAGRVEKLVNVWIFAVVIQSAVAVLDLLEVTRIGVLVTSTDYLANTGRVTGLTLHPNHLSLVTAMALPMVVGMLTSKGGRRTAGLTALPFVLAGIAVSGSRGALMAGAGGILLFFLLQARGNRSLGGVLLVAAFIAAFAYLVFSPTASERARLVTGERILTQGADDATRASLYRTAVDQGLDSPIFGQGFAVILSAHDIYLQLLQAGGAIALVAFVLFGGGIIRRSRRLARLRPADTPALPAIAAAAGASMGTWMLYGLTGNALYDRYLYIPAGLVLAIAFVSRASSPSIAHPSTRNGARAHAKGHVSAPRRRRADTRGDISVNAPRDENGARSPGGSPPVDRRSRSA